RWPAQLGSASPDHKDHNVYKSSLQVQLAGKKTCKPNRIAQTHEAFPRTGLCSGPNEQKPSSFFCLRPGFISACFLMPREGKLADASEAVTSPFTGRELP